MRKKHRKTFSFEGKRYEVSADTEMEAIVKMVDKQRALESGRVTIGGEMTVRQWTEIAFDTYKPRMKPSIKKDAKSRIEKHILKAIGSMQMKSVRPVHLQRILNAQEGMSFSHVQKLTQEIRFIFRKATDDKVILDDPSRGITPPRAEKGTRQALTEREREAFLKVCEGTDKFRVFELIYYCGCRPGEAMASQGTDLSVKGGVPLLHIRGTKTKNSDRVVPVPAVLYRKIKDTAPFSPIAPNRAGRHHTESSYNRITANLRREMNIALGARVKRNVLVPPLPLRESFVPYDLRHTYCSDLARKGVDIRMAQKLMGHSTVQLTADIYTHISEEQIVEKAAIVLYGEKDNEVVRDKKICP